MAFPLHFGPDRTFPRITCQPLSSSFDTASMVAEVRMARWIRRYEEGYISVDGETIKLSDELHRAPGWPSPEEAVKYWQTGLGLQGPTVSAYSNGLQQIDDVCDRAEFAALGVVRIWRRVTFVRVESAFSQDKPET